MGAGGQSDDESEYAASRYVPMLKSTLEELASNTLSMEDYPSVLPMPDQAPSQTSGKGGRSARSARGGASSARKNTGASSRWSKSSSGGGSGRSSGPSNFSGARNIVFLVGGAAYSELRVARSVTESSSTEVIMGSTCFLSPNAFVDDLEALGQEEE